jgi:argininosuccinate synthase
MPKVALAYSGGLDTSVAVKWLQEERGFDVIAVAVDVGEQRDYEAIRRRALDIGAVDSLVVDAKEEFAREFVFRALKANALYEGKYPVSTALARPLIAKTVGRVARDKGAQAVAHGCTGKGNDQVRFDVAFGVLYPELEIIAPFREWRVSRDEEMDWARERGVPVPTDKARPYSTDVNLWGRSIECGVLEDPWQEPPADVFEWTRSPDDAPAKPAYVEIGFEQGMPVSLDGKKLSGAKLVASLNALAGEHGVGRIDMIENRLVGFKSREIYECPAATVLLAAHRDLEAMTVERELAHYKQMLELKYGELVYYGLWYSPLRAALDAFMDSTQARVTGTVRMKLHRGTCTPVGRRSPYSLYSYELATYDKADRFDASLSKGFVQLWGLSARVAAEAERKAGGE